MSGSNNRAAATAEDRRKWVEAWSKMMEDIWHEKINRLNVIDKGELYDSVRGDGITTLSTNFDGMEVRHSFVQYGIYQDMGTGRGIYRHDIEKGHVNRGDLGETPKRKPRVWFSRAYFASVMALKEQMAFMYGEEFLGVVADAITGAESKRSTTLRSRNWGSRKGRR